jgi:hypothetical protein
MLFFFGLFLNLQNDRRTPVPKRKPVKKRTKIGRKTIQLLVYSGRPDSIIEVVILPWEFPKVQCLARNNNS